jgi:hypothetical protein
MIEVKPEPESKNENDYEIVDHNEIDFNAINEGDGKNSPNAFTIHNLNDEQKDNNLHPENINPAEEIVDTNKENLEAKNGSDSDDDSPLSYEQIISKSLKKMWKKYKYKDVGNIQKIIRVTTKKFK